MICPICGSPSRAVVRKQGGGSPALFCGDTCKQKSGAIGTKLWQQTPRGKFINQRDRAKQRGIEWQFTFEQWLAWWGDDLPYRGVTKDAMCMARFEDCGPYHPDNCYKATMSHNHRERNRIRREA